MNPIAKIVDAFRKTGTLFRGNNKISDEVPVATLSRALINPKTNMVTHRIDEDGALVDAANSPLVSRATVDSLISGVSASTTVRAATTANITIATALNDGDTLDGVTLVTGDLVLVKDQSTGSQNGIYVVGATPARDAEFDAFDEYPGLLVTVQEGTANADFTFLCINNKGGTLGSTSIVFVKYQSATAGIAYVSLAGDNSTARVGDPNRPYGTWQAAYNAGAKTFVFGAGDFYTAGKGDLVTAADEVLWVIGYGGWAAQDYVVTQLGTVDFGAHSLYLQDVHGHSCIFIAFTRTGLDGAAGAADQNGANGSNGNLTGLHLRACDVRDITASGGAGGAGGSGDTNGGNGGSACAVELDDTVVTGMVTARGGNGGALSGGGANGNGGTGGAVTVHGGSKVLGDTRIEGGTGTSVGNGGEVQVTFATMDDIIGTGGTNGTVTAKFAILKTPTDATLTKVGSIVDGTFAAS